MAYHDTISFAPAGGLLPPGLAFLVGGSGQIQAFANGGAFAPHNWLAFSGADLACTLNATSLTPTFTAWFVWKNTGFGVAGPIFRTWGLSVTNQLIITGGIQVENDGTLSAFTAGSPNTVFWNSGGLNPPFFVQPTVWYYFQLSYKVGFDGSGSGGIGGTFEITNFNLWADGILLANAEQGESNFLNDGSFTGFQASPHVAGDPGMSFIDFCQPNGSGDVGLGELFATIGASSSPSLPGGLWTVVIDSPGSLYGPLPPNITITTALGVTTVAEIRAVIDVGPGSGNTGAVISLFVADPGVGFIDLDLPINLTAVPFGTPNGSGFSGHATLVPEPPFIRVAQAVAEPGRAPIDAILHVPQLVVEHMFAPLDSFIHASQLVIELPFKKPAGSGWVVKEC